MNLTRARELTGCDRHLLGSFALFVLSLVAGLAFVTSLEGCKRTKSPPVPKTETAAADTKEQSPPPHQHPARPPSIVNAAWYDVPTLSLAWRRAGPGEFTAAHNRLPLGTHVRVTHLGNGKSVVVRITDRGITDRRIKIDLCKGAAQELGMIGEGIARVRMQVLPEEAGTSNSSVIAAQN